MVTFQDVDEATWSKREDPAPCELVCHELFDPGLSCGLYTFARAWIDSTTRVSSMTSMEECTFAKDNFQLQYAVPLKTDIFKKLALPYRTKPSVIKNIH